MYDSNKGFDLSELIFNRDNTAIWNSSHLNEYIKETIMKTLNTSLQAPSPWNFPKLNDYIIGVIEQSLTGHSNMFTNQTIDSAPPPPKLRDKVDEPHEFDFSEETSSDEVVTDTSTDFEEPAESLSHSSEIPAADPHSNIQKPDIKEQPEPLKPQIYTRSIGIQPEIMRTHSMVVIRIQLPEGISESDLRISINDDHAVIKWPAGYVEQLIPLPVDIERNMARAVLKDRILEIQIPRRHEGEFREISI